DRDAAELVVREPRRHRGAPGSGQVMSAASRRWVPIVAAAAALTIGCGRPGPPEPRPEAITEFATLYGENCSGWHGPQGRQGRARPVEGRRRGCERDHGRGGAGHANEGVREGRGRLVARPEIGRARRGRAPRRGGPLRPADPRRAAAAVLGGPGGSGRRSGP